MQLPMAMAMAIAMVMAMAMAMISNVWKPQLMLQSHDEAYTMIGGYAEIAVSNSGNDQHLVQVMSARLDGRMPDIPDVEIWRTVSLWMFLLFHLFCSLYFFASWIPAQYKWHWHRFWDPWKDHPERSRPVVGIRGSYVRIRWTVDWFFSFISFSSMGLCNPGGLHL